MHRLLSLMLMLACLGCSGAFQIDGVLAPTETCVVNAEEDPLLVDGEMEIGDGSENANEYQAVLKVENHLLGDLNVSGYTVSYEYPVAPTSLSVRSFGPMGQEVRSVDAGVGGVISADNVGAVTVTLIDRERAQELFKDPVVKKAAGNPTGFVVRTKVALQGWAGPVAVRGNELTFNVRLTQGRIRNCGPIDEACALHNSDSMGERRNQQCFPDQDVEECVCVPNKPYCTGVCVTR